LGFSMVVAGPKFDNKGGENLNFSKILRNRRKLIFLKRICHWIVHEHKYQ
jgi:hypothetical protein